MQVNNLERWEVEFRLTAQADNFALFSDHLHRLGLPDEPELLLQGTVLIVKACCAYSSLDGQKIVEFLKLQKYNPAEAPGAEYAFAFDLCGKGFGRVLVSAKQEGLDLADLYGHPWGEYEVCGYQTFWISRTDGKNLSDDEIMRLKDEVVEDLRFDYSEDELGFYFDGIAVEGILEINLYDI